MQQVFVWAGLCAWFVAATSHAAAAERTAPELFPASTIIYAEVPEPAPLLELILDHPLARELAALPEYRKATEAPQWQAVEAVNQHLAQRLGVPRRRAVETLVRGGVYVGFDLPTQGVVALAQAADEMAAMGARDALIEYVREDAAVKKQPNPVQEDELSGMRVHAIGKLHLAVMGKWLLVTNKPLLAFMVLENYRGTGSGTLAASTHFQQVLGGRAGQETAWVYADLRILQQMRKLTELAQKKSDNPLLELLVGGIVGLLPEAAHATLSAKVDATSVAITATLPGDPANVAKPREYYFGPAGEGAAPALLKPAGTLITLSTYRDLGALWRNAPDLFDDRVNARLAQAESQLTTFFAGRDFRDDILGNLQPQIQLVVARRDFSGDSLRPSIKLPAVGIVLRLKSPENTARVFKVTFQSLVGFLNVVGGMKKVDPLELSSETVDGAVVVSTQFLAAPESEAAAQRGEGKIHFNASPTAVFSGDRFILASARPLALALLEQANKESPISEPLNTQVVMDGKVLQAVLADNREPLVAQNMLSKGHDRSAGEHEIDRLLRLLVHFDGFSLRLLALDKQLQLTAGATLRSGP